jgi:hypothetical protein
MVISLTPKRFRCKISFFNMRQTPRDDDDLVDLIAETDASESNE